jgi:hypothetical protein
MITPTQNTFFYETLQRGEVVIVCNLTKLYHIGGISYGFFKISIMRRY